MRKTFLLPFLSFTLMMFMASSTIAQIQPKPTLSWQKCIGGTQLDVASSILTTFDNAYVVLGATNSTDGDVDSNEGQMDVFIAKLSLTGNIIWKRNFGSSGDDEGVHFQQTADSGFIIAAYSTFSDGDVDTNYGLRDVWIIKLTKTGDIQWQKTYGGSANDMALTIKQTVDGGYIFAGWSASSNGDITLNKGFEDCWVVKLNATGAITWQKTFGGTGEDHFTSITATSDGGYLAVGSVKSNNGDVVGHHGSDDYWIVKLNSSGNMIWQKTYGGSGQDHCGDHAIAGSVQETFDGGFILSGFSNSNNGDVVGNHGDYDAWILKLNSTGNIVWQRSVGGSGDDEAFYIIQMPDSSYIAAGITNSTNGDVDTMYGVYDMWCFKLSPNGTLLWEQSFGGMFKESAFALARTNDTSVILAGYSTFPHGQVTGAKGGTHDMWVVKLKMTPIINGLPGINARELTIAPNPTNGFIQVKGGENAVLLKLHNVTGQCVKESSSHQLSFPELPAGIYILKVLDKSGMLLKQEKIVKL
ncbi:MAG TPA: T9SS type A sorting domain-containing protein [Flavipsychrobacter sp.]|nr:T9SS type A sorting domain-containing protein [Flavipsychrobacter sp.]